MRSGGATEEPRALGPQVPAWGAAATGDMVDMVDRMIGVRVTGALLHAPPEWRPCVGAPRYEVSSCGEVRSVDGHRMIAVHANDGGYLAVKLTIGANKRRWFKVHALVLTTFAKGRPTPRHHGAHLDGKKTNNHAWNLAWKLPPENEADKKEPGTAPKGGASKRPSARVVAAIRKRVAAGESLSSAARRYGLHRHSVSRYVRGLRRNA